jgi:hypothetical protein
MEIGTQFDYKMGHIRTSKITLQVGGITVTQEAFLASLRDQIRLLEALSELPINQPFTTSASLSYGHQNWNRLQG